MKITKKTLILLKRFGNARNANYNYRISLIADILLTAGAICGDTKEGYEIYDAESCGVGFVYSDVSRKYARGMASRYPSFVETTLTHGNNQVRIVDVNKLVNAILSE